MAEAPADTESHPKGSIPLEPIGSATAPIIYFDLATTQGLMHGVGNITIEAFRWRVDVDGVAVERVTVANLRASLDGIRSLRDSLNTVLLLAAPPASESAN